MIGQRTREGLAVKRVQGIRLGRPRSVTDATSKQIRKWREAGQSYQQIADRLNASGSTSPSGKQWAWTTIRRVAERT
jgi:DNA invertase Pin-like site-specific DNA recombinase